MPPFDIVHAVTPYSEHTLREHLRTIHETALRTTLVDENIFFQKKFSFEAEDRERGMGS